MVSKTECKEYLEALSKLLFDKKIDELNTAHFKTIELNIYVRNRTGELDDNTKDELIKVLKENWRK